MYYYNHSLQLHHINELRKIKNLKELKSLIVDGNPICGNYSNSQTGYVRYMAGLYTKRVEILSFSIDIIVVNFLDADWLKSFNNCAN
jgi:hypothetical protein